MSELLKKIYIFFLGSFTGILLLILLFITNNFFVNNGFNNFRFNNINTCSYSVDDYCETSGFVGLQGAAQDQIIKLNFDKIFPETPVSKVFDSCAKIYQELNFEGVNEFFKYLIRSGNKTEIDFDIFTDLLVGKLFNIKVGISKVIDYKAEDIDYLNKIFDKILFDYQETCKLCSNFFNIQKSENVQEIIKEIKNELIN